MASSANPGLWPALSDLSGADACAALLKVNAEMFAAAPARDRESIETFEALALGFLPKADHATLLEIAQILARCQDTPPSVLDYLRRHLPESRETVPLQGASSPACRLDRRLFATAAGRAQLASRDRLDEADIERLLVLREESCEDTLAANPAFPPSMPTFHELVRRAVERPALARILLRRGDLSATQESCLYLAADRERQRHIRETIATLLAPVRAPSCRLAEHDVAALRKAANEGDVPGFERWLTRAFGFPDPVDWRLLQTGRHPLLAVALKALGMPERDAIRILLTLHPALSYPLSEIRRLVRTMREVPGPVALVLVEAILGAKALREASRAF
ncbi:hypothetical protein [Microvirga sp. TS319]|uniref:hypothetical protein n=1 Tax=Microvirga sp. TS319 TaxID=3241165 RepID=UPI00351A252E